MASCTRSNRRAGRACLRKRARLRDVAILRVILAAAALCAAAPAAVQAGPDPCTGVGTVTCSGNQSAGVENPPPGTTVLDVNSLSGNIAPPAASGQPGILFFGAGNITLNSATGPFGIISSGDFVDGIVVATDGAIKVTSSGNISINGLFANGINALSFAAGPINVTSSSNISLANGGNGILAYSDGSVAITSSGMISVAGDGTGINATAGSHVTVNSSGPISMTGGGDAIDISDIGGPTGGGGVTVISSGAISLAGNSAIAINAYSEETDPVSVASSSNISLADGGSGIVGFSDGAVSVNSSGAISVAGSLGGAGIVAASGGVGTAGVTSSGGVAIEGDGAAIVAFSVGGSANVVSSANISVGGSGIGISAFGLTGAAVSSSAGVSIGGDGNAINALSLDGAAKVTSSGRVSIGGDGDAIAAASAGGAASVKSSGNISVGGSGTGIAAQGDIAQINSSGDIAVAKGGQGIAASGANGAAVNSSGAISLGGDGDAIDAASTAGAANVTSSGNIAIGGTGIGVNVEGNTAQVTSSGTISVAKGGQGIAASGASGAAVNSSSRVSIGGDGDAIDAVSKTGAADVTSSGDILIGGAGSGVNASGNTAQVNASGDISVTRGGMGISAFGASGAAVSSSGAISIGGSGDAIDASSTGGAANVTSSGEISVEGTGTGINAQGNLVQVNSSGAVSIANGGTGISASGANGATVGSSGAISLRGNGEAIDAVSAAGAAHVASSGDISIAGSGTGISAVGGTAGTVLASGNISIAGSGTGISAVGGTVDTVIASGNISIGGGGTGISADGGAVDIKSSGDVGAPGNNSVGIGTSASGHDIAVKIAGGTITGGSGTGAGIVLAGGADNTLTNFGTITTSPGLAGTAILGMPIPGVTSVSPAVVGNNTVNNSGVVTGNVDLGPGRNAFNNLPGATFNSGATVALGAGNTLTNTGNLSPGGSGVIQTTVLTGNLVQGGAGKITVDVNPATSQADRIVASGSANLGGEVTLNLANATPTTGATSLTLVHADGGVTDNGLALGALPAVAAYQLEFTDANDLVLQGGLNFAPAGLNGNQTAIGQNVNAIQLAGGSSSFLPVVQAILTIPDVASLGQAYDQLSPETYADNEIGDFYSGLRFANSLMSCDVADGRYVFIKEGQCVWAQVGGKFLNLNATSGSLGFNESAFTASGGAEIMLRPDWFASFALGYDHGNTSTSDTLAESQTDRAHFGAAIKYNPGPYLFAAAVYGGYGWYTTDRFINFGGFDATASSDSLISRVGGQFRAAYLVDRGSWYLKPLVDLNVTHVNLNAFSEQGAGGADLIVSGTGETVFSASPAVEIGTQRSLQNGALLRPFAQLGMTAFSNTNFPVSASFSGAPAGTAPFAVATGIDSVTADVAAGADLFLPDSRWVLKLAYTGHYGARVRDNGVRLKASIRF